MESEPRASGAGMGARTPAYRRYSRVLLREPERCAECNRVFVSLYPLRRCDDHAGLEEI